MTRPFLVDPEVMARIRPMTADDCGRVAELHRAAMGSSLWALLGQTFLERLYQGLVRHPDFYGFVYEEEGIVGGFIAGTTDSSRLFRQVLMRSWPGFVGPVLGAILRRPALLVHLFATPLYWKRSRVDAEVAGTAAESLFCSFVPRLRGRRIAGHINKVLFDELRARGQRRVKITTETDNLAAVRQLKSWGFTRRGTFRFYGKDMAVYLLDLTATDRVEPVSRHPGPWSVSSRGRALPRPDPATPP